MPRLGYSPERAVGAQLLCRHTRRAALSPIAHDSLTSVRLFVAWLRRRLAPYSDSNAAVRCTPTPGRLAPVLRLQRRRPLYSDSKASRAADCFIRASSPRPAARGRRARVDASASGVQLGEEIRRGDAGYFKDPLTAYGITDAFRDAELLARAMVAGTAEAFAGYQALRRSEEHTSELQSPS